MGDPYISWYGRGRHQAWETPPDFFERLTWVYQFNLDGAASPSNQLCWEGSTPERPVPWTGRRVFCNPPWSDIASFVEYAPSADVAVLLVPARTNAKWFHRALALGARVEFFPGRLKFWRDGGPADNSPVDCLLLVFFGPSA